MRVKLLNLNVWHGGKYLWNNLCYYLKKEQPDIIMLQEASASSAPTTTPYLNTVASLQKLLDYPYSEYQLQYHETVGEETLPLSNVILSKAPLLNKTVQWLHGTGPGSVDSSNPSSFPHAPRNLLHCQVSTSGKLYNLMTLQGVWAPDDNVTAGQIEFGQKVANYIKDKPNVILAGDFNIREGTEPIHTIEQHLINVFAGERKSSFNMKHKSNPGYAAAVVDFVFTSPNIKILDHYTPDTDVSDHQGQVVIFDL